MTQHDTTSERHAIRLVRHELKRRSLTISQIEQLTPRMRRIHLRSSELKDFHSAASDDHVKLFFSAPDASTVARDYTPRRWDGETLVIDFAIHDDGPATRWAKGAQVGDTLQIGGPRGSRVLPDDFDWYLLVGDETALPAIGRRLEELRASVPVITVVTLIDRAERQQLETRAAWSPHWLERGTDSTRDAAQLTAALRELRLPAGDGYIWIAGELSIAQAVRAYALDELAHPRAWLRASGYWQRGAAGAHVEVGRD